MKPYSSKQAPGDAAKHSPSNAKALDGERGRGILHARAHQGEQRGPHPKARARAATSFLRRSARLQALNEELARRNAELSEVRLDLEYELAERERAEQAIQDRDQFIQHLFELSPAAIYLLDLENSQFITFNQEFRNRLGYSEEAFEAFRTQELSGWMTPEDLVRYQDHLHLLAGIPDGTPLPVEFHMRGADGHWHAILAHETVYKRDDQGKPVQILGTALDVTARNQAEQDRQRLLEENRRQREFFEAALHQLPSGVIIYEAGTKKLILSSEQVGQILGMPAHTGQLVSAFAQNKIRHLDGTPYRLEEWSVVRCVEKGESVSQEELVFERPDARQVILSVSAAPVMDPEGKVEAIVVTFQDITARKQVEERLQESEERFQLASRATNDVIWDWDIPSGSIRWNENIGALFGYPEAFESGTGLDWWMQRVHPDDLARLTHMMTESIQGGGKHWTAEYRFRKMDGTYAHVLDHGLVVADSAGQAQRMVGAVLDITPLKRAQQTAQEYARRLEQSNRDLEDFAFVASHDLQEPLRKILAFSKLVENQFEQGVPEEGLPYLVRMRDAARRMQALLDGLLDYSRLSTQAKTFTRVDLNEVARNVLSNLEGRILDTRGVVEVSPLPDVDADPLQMEQLFQNLIANALKFHRPGIAPRIIVRGESRSNAAGAGHEQQGLREVVVTVEDNGIGIEPVYFDQIFQPFSRLHGRNQYEGSGMGLPICRKIVERHSGSIRVYGNPAGGSTFTVVLPARQAVSPP